MTDIASLLKQARELLAKATPAPWAAEGQIDANGACTIWYSEVNSGVSIANTCDECDADFIAFARNNILALADECERLQKGHKVLNAALACDDDEVVNFQVRLNRSVEWSKVLAADYERLEAENETLKVLQKHSTPNGIHDALRAENEALKIELKLSNEALAIMTQRNGELIIATLPPRKAPQC